jgi:hypothetical protein
MKGGNNGRREQQNEGTNDWNDTSSALFKNLVIA